MVCWVQKQTKKYNTPMYDGKMVWRADSPFNFIGPNRSSRLWCSKTLYIVKWCLSSHHQRLTLWPFRATCSAPTSFLWSAQQGSNRRCCCDETQPITGRNLYFFLLAHLGNQLSMLYETRVHIRNKCISDRTGLLQVSHWSYAVNTTFTNVRFQEVILNFTALKVSFWLSV